MAEHRRLLCKSTLTARLHTIVSFSFLQPRTARMLTVRAPNVALSHHERPPKRHFLVHLKRADLGLASLQRRRVAERTLRPTRRERARQAPVEHAQSRACSSAPPTRAGRQHGVRRELLEHHRAAPLQLQRLHATLVATVNGPFSCHLPLSLCFVFCAFTFALCQIAFFKGPLSVTNRSHATTTLSFPSN